jgi:transposase
MITIGIDVSKEKLDLFWIKDVDTRKGKSKIFKNHSSDFPLLIDWATKNTQVSVDQLQFVMEATGIYHEALAYALHQSGARVSVVNPAKIKSHARSLGVRTKTDKKDSLVIAHYGATMQPMAWCPEPPEIRELKALISRFHAVDKDLRRELNRLEKVHITQVSVVVCASIETMVATLKEQKKLLEKQIQDHIDNYPTLKKDQDLLLSIPSIGSVTSVLMLSVIRSRGFRQASQCSAFLGLNPIQHDSGKTVRCKPRLSKVGDAQVRAKLYMAAIVAIKHNPDIKKQYERLLRNGKSKMAALCAAMRKLVQICFGVLKHQSEYQPQSL